MPVKLNLIGQKFGKLLVLYEDSKSNRKFIKWVCQCDCGNITSVRGAALKNGHTTTCGCSQYDRIYTPQMFNARTVWWTFKNEITFEDFLEISQQNCYWCGIGPSTISCVKNRGKLFVENPFIWNGLDRLDNSNNHNKNNVVPCCAVCNISRNKKTTQEFIEWIDRIHNHQHRMHNTI